MVTPDKRWRHRFRKAEDAVETLRHCLTELAALDADATDAIWQSDAFDARRSVEGINALLLDADAERTAHLARMSEKATR